MKTFDVYKHPTQGYQAVKQGFSWPALAFTWLWAFVKKMWGFGFAALGIMFLLGYVSVVFETQGREGGVVFMFFGQWGVHLIFGFQGNDWRRWWLGKRGFHKMRTVEAVTPEGAIADAVEGSR